MNVCFFGENLKIVLRHLRIRAIFECNLEIFEQSSNRFFVT